MDSKENNSNLGLKKLTGAESYETLCAFMQEHEVTFDDLSADTGILFQKTYMPQAAVYAEYDEIILDLVRETGIAKEEIIGLFEQASQDEEIRINHLAESTLFEVCDFVQKSVGQKYGDVAAAFFSGEDGNKIKDILKRYISTELKDVKNSTSDQPLFSHKDHGCDNDILQTESAKP